MYKLVKCKYQNVIRTYQTLILSPLAASPLQYQKINFIFKLLIFKLTSLLIFKEKYNL